MLRFVVLAVCVLGSLGVVRYDNYQVYEVSAQSNEDINLINDLENDDDLLLDIWRSAGGVGPAHISVSPEKREHFLDKLRQLGVGYRLVVPNVQAQIDEVDRQTAKIPRSLRTIQNTYQTYEQNVAILDELHATYPDMMSIVNYGTSRGGRDLFYVKLSGERFSSPNPEDSTKPVIWLEHTTHSREWISNAAALNLIDYLLKNYGVTSEAIYMMDTFDWFIVPVQNPDGYDYSQTDRMWRKTRTGGSCSEGNGRGSGVDPNRNWGYQWAATRIYIYWTMVFIGGGSVCVESYPGPEAFSEPCVKLFEATMDRTPAHLRRAFFAVHSYSQLFVLPYGYSSSVRPDNFEDQLKVANAAVSAIFDHSGTIFRAGQSTDFFSPSFGASDDHGHGGLGFTVSCTVELHPDHFNPGFHLPPDRIAPSFGDFLVGLHAMCKELEQL